MRDAEGPGGGAIAGRLNFSPQELGFIVEESGSGFRMHPRAPWTLVNFTGIHF